MKPEFTKAVVCFLIKGDEVLLGRRKKVSNDLGLNIISGIGGKLEAGESNSQALLREVEEEIGVTLKDYTCVGSVKFTFVNKPAWNQDVAIYLSTSWEGNPIETDVIQPSWFAREHLPLQQMWEDNAIWVPRVLMGELIDAFFHYGASGRVEEYNFL